MNIKKEQPLKPQYIENTPHAVLKQLFNYIENHRINIEEKQLGYYNQKTAYFKNLIKEAEQEIKTVTAKEAKEYKKDIEAYEKFITGYKKNITKIIANLDILWGNQVAIGKVLGYELED